jgi:hypothetical protein
MQQLKELPTNKLVELDSKILKNFVKPIIEFLKRRISFFLIEDFDNNLYNEVYEKAIIYYFNDGYYLPIINYKFIDRNRNLLLFSFSKKSIF